MIDFVTRRRRYFLGSALFIICGLIFLAVLGPPLGIDFTGGVVMGLEFNQPITQDMLEVKLSELGHSGAIIQSTGKNSFLVRTGELEEEEKAQITKSFKDLGLASEPSFDYVSDPIAKEKARGAAIAVAIASIGILLYISWAFRKLPNPFRYGTCAVIALVHDVLIVTAFFAIFGRYLNLEINLMFITGILAVIGYSINNTIVVFDRVRENLSKGMRLSFEAVVNNSLVETLGRSLNTSLTTLVVLLAIFFFVGVAIRSFILVLLIGIIAGTYSSLFIASQILVAWEKGELVRLFRRSS